MQRDSFHLKLYDLLEASACFDLTAGGTVAKDHAGTSRFAHANPRGELEGHEHASLED